MTSLKIRSQALTCVLRAHPREKEDTKELGWESETFWVLLLARHSKNYTTFWIHHYFRLFEFTVSNDSNLVPRVLGTRLPQTGVYAVTNNFVRKLFRVTE